MTNIDTALVERAKELLVTELRCDGAHLLAVMIENLNDGAIVSNPPTSSAIRAIVTALQSTREKEAREALEMAHALIQEAKGAEGPSGGFVTNHLDAAEHWLDKVEAALSDGEREALPVQGGEEERARIVAWLRLVAHGAREAGQTKESAILYQVASMLESSAHLPPPAPAVGEESGE